ncbi:MAG: crossover junction endodeoxyribonuclease RuvC [Nakamurella sp.]
MRVLGVDPGLTRCGIGVVDGGPGLRPAMVEVVVVRTPPTTELALRLLAIAEQVESMMDRLKPDTVAIERMFSQHNVRTVMGTAQASGVVALAAARRSIPVAWHTPSEVKAAVSGNGNADKAQVTAMITRLLRLPDAPKPADAADALALALCHLWRSPMQNGLLAAATKARMQP